MGRDSNPRYLAVHTLSRRAQSTTLSPILGRIDNRKIDNQSCKRRNNSSSGSWMAMKNSPKSAYSALTGSNRIS
jgi:hypothetical protein